MLKNLKCPKYTRNSLTRWYDIYYRLGTGSAWFLKAGKWVIKQCLYLSKWSEKYLRNLTEIIIVTLNRWRQKARVVCLISFSWPFVGSVCEPLFSSPEHSSKNNVIKQEPILLNKAYLKMPKENTPVDVWKNFAKNGLR